jgi:transposase
MAMGTRKQREKQEDIWIAHTELASAPGHPFFQRLNELLEGEQFDQFVEERWAKFYTSQYGVAVADPRHLHPVVAHRLF